MDMDDLLYHPVPKRVSWWDFLGFADAALFVNQAVTGMLLATRYRPSVASGTANFPDAYQSIQEIMAAPAGPLIRGLHAWGANAIVVLVFLHALRAFYIGAYKRPRQATWIFGVLLGAVTILFGFSGYLLPWDQQAYWATTVGTAMSTYAPLVGNWLIELARGGAYITGLTLSRFFALHTMLLPALFLLIFAVHLLLVINKGMVEVEEAVPKSYKRTHTPGAKGDIPAGFMPFWPNTIFRMALQVALVGVVLVTLAVIFRPGLGSPADPLNRENYQPVPIWYFLSIYQMLKFLPGRMDAIGIIGFPLLAGIVLLGLPYFDRNPSRSPRRRPLAMAAAVILTGGITAFTYIGWKSTVQTGGSQVKLKDHPSFKADITPVLQGSCANCHMGGKKSGGLDLSTYESLIKGGRRGSPVKPGDPDGSLLIQTVQGTSTEVPPMPLGQQPIPATHIQLLKNWIKDGAHNN